MIATFDKRIESTALASDAWIDHCRSNGFHYAFTGYENFKKSDGFMLAMKDEHVLDVYPYPKWSKMRYIPDMFVIDTLSNGYFVDVKYGKNNCIERDAYEFYKDISREKEKIDVYLVKLRDGYLHSMHIDDTKLFYTDENIYGGVPVVDRCNYHPRDLPTDKRKEWQQKHGGSSTPYKIIDNSKDFKKIEMSEHHDRTGEIQASVYMKHKEISDKFIGFCKSSKREYAFCGAENWGRSESFLPTLKKSKNQTCQLIKHFPDMMVIKPYKIFGERFGGSLIKFIGPDFRIEQDAFTLLQDLYCMGMGVTLITVQNNELKYCLIQHANVKDLGTDWNGIPVFENRWANPKKLKPIECAEWRRKNNDDSFGFIDDKCFKNLEL